jgi:hypothetical protein
MKKAKGRSGTGGGSGEVGMAQRSRRDIRANKPEAIEPMTMDELETAVDHEDESSARARGGRGGRRIETGTVVAVDAATMEADAATASTMGRGQTGGRGDIATRGKKPQTGGPKKVGAKSSPSKSRGTSKSPKSSTRTGKGAGQASKSTKRGSRGRD